MVGDYTMVVDSGPQGKVQNSRGRDDGEGISCVGGRVGREEESCVEEVS